MLPITDWIWAKFNRFPTNNSFAKKLSFTGSISNVRFAENLCYIYLFISTIAGTFRKLLPEIRSKFFLAMIRKIPSTIFYVFFTKRLFLVTISSIFFQKLVMTTNSSSAHPFSILCFYISKRLHFCISVMKIKSERDNCRVSLSATAGTKIWHVIISMGLFCLFVLFSLHFCVSKCTFIWHCVVCLFISKYII